MEVLQYMQLKSTLQYRNLPWFIIYRQVIFIKQFVQYTLYYYVCMCAYVLFFATARAYVCVCICACVWGGVPVCVCVHVCACVWVCIVCRCVGVGMCVCMCVNVYCV